MTTQTKAKVAPLGQPTVVKLSAITAYGRNPRRIPAKAVEQTAKSIREFGWQQPIVVDPEMVIIAGHVRQAAAKSLGLTEVPVIIADKLTPQQARAFRVADNRAHDYTTWDYTTLIEELNGLGSDFAEVLDVADWASLMSAFETQEGSGTHLLPGAADSPVPGSSGFVLRVEFASQDDADRAGPSLMQIPGVLNVRHST